MANNRVPVVCLLIILCRCWPVSSGPCGNIARPDPRNRGAPGWKLCYIELPEDGAYASKRCSELVRDVFSPGRHTTYATSQELQNAGGGFGCWYDRRGLDSNIHKACRRGKGHNVSLMEAGLRDSRHNILGICIQFPPVLTRSILTVSESSPCGNIARPDPQVRDPDGWVLCYIQLPQDQAYAHTRCDGLITSVEDPMTGLVYETDADLLEAGGQFGCWYDTDGLSSEIDKACVPRRGHHVALANHDGTNILGVCIQYPLTPSGITVTTLAPTNANSGPCGSITRPDPKNRDLPGWTLCHILLPQDQAYITTKCADLIKNVISPGTGIVYHADTDLLAAGGQFGCWYDKELDGDIHKACNPGRGHHLTLGSHSGTKILSVCIQFPASATNVAMTTLASTKEAGITTWMVVGIILAVILSFALAALSIFGYHCIRKRKTAGACELQKPQTVALEDLLASRPGSETHKHVYDEDGASCKAASATRWRRLPSVPGGEECIYEEIPERTDDYEVPVPSPHARGNGTASQDIYLDMSNANKDAGNISSNKLSQKYSRAEDPRGDIPDGACGHISEERYANMP